MGQYGRIILIKLIGSKYQAYLRWNFRTRLLPAGHGGTATRLKLQHLVDALVVFGVHTCTKENMQQPGPLRMLASSIVIAMPR